MKLQRNIGLTEGVAIVTGSVIGMGAFVLLPIVCAQAQGAAWLAVALAVGISMVSMMPLIQLGSAWPVAGGGYAYGSRLLSPTLGVLLSWWGVLGGAAALALVAYGLVESFRGYLPPGLSLHLVALAIVMLFYLVQYAGLRMLAALQVVLVVQMLVALLCYAFAALGAEGHGFHPAMPSDTGFLIGLAVAFNICLGFQVVVELGEEMCSPERNIFRTLVIGAGIILGIYLLLVAAFSHLVGAIGMDDRPDLIMTALPIMPEWGVRFLQLGVIGAALTSFNGTAIAIPREIYAQGRGGALPRVFGELDRNGSPRHAVALYFALVAALLLLGALLDSLGVLAHFFGRDAIEFYGFITVCGILLLTIGLCVAAWRLPHEMPEVYAQAKVRLNPATLRASIIVSVVCNTVLIALMCSKWIVPLVIIIFGTMIMLLLRGRGDVGLPSAGEGEAADSH